MSKRTLTFEQTRGTKTYHLPFGKGEQPRLTLMVRRMPDGSFHAGVSICAQEDLFTRRAGRARSFHRLNGRPLSAPDALGIFEEVNRLIKNVNARRPGTVPDSAEFNLMEVCAFLNESFDKLEANRTAKLTGDVAEIALERVVDIEIDLPTEDGYQIGGC